MKIKQMKSKLVLKADAGEWITKEGYPFFTKQLIATEATVSDYFTVTDEQKEAIEAERSDSEIVEGE